jgi:hypothetical protein
VRGMRALVLAVCLVSQVALAKPAAKTTTVH